MKKLKTIFNSDNFLFSSWFMGVLFILFAVSMAFATFIENDYGQMAAREVVYNTKWFEGIFLLMVINFTGHIVRYKLYRWKKLPQMMLHVAFILIIAGAAITRYAGYEGTIHLREGQTKNKIQTIDQYLKLNITDKNNNSLYSSAEKFTVTPITSDNYSKSVKTEGYEYKIDYKGYIPNAVKKVAEDPNGQPLIHLLVSRDMETTHNIILEEGQVKNIANMSFGLNNDKNADVNIQQQGDRFIMKLPWEVQRLNMNTRETENFSKDETIPFEELFIYNIKGWRIVVREVTPSGIIKPAKAQQRDQQMHDALHFELEDGKKTSDMFLWMNGDSSSTAKYSNNGHLVELHYAPKTIQLPFSLKLNEFIMERYPGSDAPSSYKSDVTVMDNENNEEFSYMIFMNNILKYRGYRFFQSSFDKDEQGSVLSVNYDVAGMSATYSGYTLLFLCIILSLINKHSLFRKANPGFWPAPRLKSTTAAILFLFLGISSTYAAGEKFEPDKKVADEFGEILVQDQKGRTKPLYTLSDEILRKVSRSHTYNGLSSMQVFLGMYYDFENWKNVPLIKVGNSEVKKIIGLKGDYAAFTDIVPPGQNRYKLREYVQRAYEKSDGERDKFDKEVMKVDERMNICFMIMQGEFLKIFPYENEEGKWATPEKILEHTDNKKDSSFYKNILPNFKNEIAKGNNENATELIHSLKNYQRENATYKLPSEKKVNIEILYHKSKIFERLFPFFAITGLIMLTLLFIRIIKGKRVAPVMIKILTALIALGFLLQTTGLGVRWYISGHAPMSNGYESMLFVSWATILAGFLFLKKSKLTLAATALLAAFALMVAHMGFMDPEITNLVPVLQSYWLTLHVSIITSSYGFLALSAILGLINVVSFLSISRKNHTRILPSIQELTVINYKSMTIGLYLLTIGTFLGAIWANESWGRYWGWDPKETWSLITIIVYSFIIHSRIIPGLKTLFSFNVMALFGFSSVLMTYFGVNYYLSGLHSYAGGDPVPVPPFVYISVIILIVLTVVAYVNKKKTLMVKEV
ncbi:MAG: c-type cytochrome biogenesis protein CcsB [Bacteroidota bacterium]